MATFRAPSPPPRMTRRSPRHRQREHWHECAHASAPLAMILRRFRRHEWQRGFPLVLTAHDVAKVLRAHGHDPGTELPVPVTGGAGVRLDTTSRFHPGFPWRCCVTVAAVTAHSHGTWAHARGRNWQRPGQRHCAAAADDDSDERDVTVAVRAAQEALFRDYLPESARADPCWGGPCVHMQAAGPAGVL